MITRYNIYNEGVRELMVPKSGEDIKIGFEKIKDNMKQKIVQLANRYDLDLVEKHDEFSLVFNLVKGDVKIWLVRDVLSTEQYITGYYDKKNNDEDEMIYSDFSDAINQVKDYIDNCFNNFVHEGVRSKMTPKPVNQIRNDMVEYFERNKMYGPNKEIAKTGVFGSSENVFYVEYWEDYFQNINSYFIDLTNKTNKLFQMTDNLGTYVCYPEVKVVEYTEKGEDTTGWYFSEEYVEPIIEYITNRMSHNESVRSKMTGRSVEDIKKSLEKMNSENKLITIRKYDLEDNYTDKELNDMFEKTAIRVSDILMRDYDFHYEDNAYQWALSHRNGILDLLEKGYLMTDLVFKLMMGYDRPDEDDWLFGNDTNESLRDKMTPKSRREIIDNIRKMSSEDYEEHVSDEIISHNMFMLLSNDHKNREFYRQITRDGHKKGILPSESAKAIFDLYHQLNNTGFYKKRIE
jgi:hypothetical protein